MKEKCTKKSMVVYIIIVLVLVCGSYYMGYQGGKNSSSSQMAGGYGNGGQRNGGGNRGGGMVNGDVISKDDTSITVKGRDGSSKIILYSGSTQVMKSTSGASTDISIGSQIIVQGKANTDGSVTAQTIQIRPNMPKPDQVPATN